MDWRTPGYMIRKEVKRDKMRTRAGRRAWKYEKKLRKGERSEIARECLKEIKEREQERGENISDWERGRGIVKEQGRRIEGEDEEQERKENKGYEKIEREDRKEQEKKRYEKKRQSRYNKWYREITVKRLPKYLRMGWKEERCKRIARYRVGNEMRGGWFWGTEKKRREERVREKQKSKGEGKRLCIKNV